MKIAFFDTKQYDEDTFKKILPKEVTVEWIKAGLTLDTVHKAKGYDAVCLFVNCVANEEVLKKLSLGGVKYIFQRSAGYNNIDLKKATELGIKVFRVPAYSPEGVAEFAMTLLMAINRNIHIAHMRTSHKNFALEGLQGETIFGLTIGVLGAGKIGQAFIKIANGFGANVIVFDEYASKNFPDSAKESNFKFVDKETFFRESDFISIHAPLTPETKYIINKDTLSLMKPSAIIVNTARGALINTSDLLDALDYGKIRGAGLDVYEKEEGVFFFDRSNDLIPDPFLNRLRAHRNVILTSHQAFFTNLALRQIAETSIQNIKDAMNNNFENALEIMPDGKIKNG